MLSTIVVDACEWNHWIIVYVQIVIHYHIIFDLDPYDVHYHILDLDPYDLSTQHLQTPKKSTQLFAAKALDRIPICPRERLVFISISTGLSFAKKKLGHFLRLFVTFVTCSLFCCIVRKPLKIRLLSIHRDFLLHTTVQHLL